MKRKSLRRRIVIVAAVMLGAFVISTLAIVVSGLRDDIANADAALVLGSKVELDGTPSPRLRARLDRTLELFLAGNFPQIIVSGGIGKEGYDEAAVMRDYLIARGVPSDRIIVDSLGDTTRQVCSPCRTRVGCCALDALRVGRPSLRRPSGPVRL